MRAPFCGALGGAAKRARGDVCHRGDVVPEGDAATARLPSMASELALLARDGSAYSGAGEDGADLTVSTPSSPVGITREGTGATCRVDRLLFRLDLPAPEEDMIAASPRSHKREMANAPP